MFTLVRSAYDWITQKSVSEDNYDDKIKELQSRYQNLCTKYEEQNRKEITIKEKEQINDDQCFQKIGRVTSMDGKCGIIDNCMTFNSEMAGEFVDKLVVGSRVTYLAFKPSDLETPIIVKIKFHLNELWDEQPIAIQNSEVENESSDLRTEYYSVHQRSVLGTISSRRRNLITVDTDQAEPITIDLENVEILFTPMIGDQVYLNCHVQSDLSFVDMAGEIIKVVAVHPARSKAIKGFITYYDSDTRTGDIDRTYFFTLDVLAADYQRPQIGDEVVADIIESEQGSMSWRCINMVQSTQCTVTNKIQRRNPEITECTQLMKNKNGLIMSTVKAVSLTDLNQTAEITITVENTNGQKIRVLDTFFTTRKADSQLELLKPQLTESFYIEPKSTVDFILKVTTRLFGESEEMFVVKFDGYIKIGRKIIIRVEDKSKSSNQPASNQANRSREAEYKSNAKEIWNNKSDMIPGEKIRSTPKFVHIKFEAYEVPQKIKNLILSSNTQVEVNGHLDTNLPVFSNPLQIKTYQSFFHNLLYMEEVALFQNIRRFDRDRAHFTREREFLSLKVENISETRPSLVLGDSVRAKSLRSPDDKSCFEGIIHKVLNDRVLFKFSPCFHDRYDGESYRLEFYFSRSGLRKQHHAIDQAYKKLGQSFLFSINVQAQEPKMNVELIDEDLVENGQVLELFNPNLNKYQKIAIKNILRGEARPMPYVIFGPPGTGKTITLVEAILQVVALFPDSRLLVGTPSNSAANLITERIIRSNVLHPGDFIRIVGQNAVERESIPEELLAYCATCDIAAEGSTRNEMITTESGLKLRCNSSFIGRHRITIGTCSTLGSLMHMRFPRDHFTHVFIDECGQLLEPEALIPMTMLNRSTGQVILAGDPQQLGPIVLSPYAKERDLDQSFFVRLLNRLPYKKDSERFENAYDARLVTKLLYNYRSVPSILKLYSDLFYDGRLIPTITSSSSDEFKILQKLQQLVAKSEKVSKEHGIHFVGVKGVNQQSTNSPSWFNSAEVNSVYFFLLALYRIGFKNHDIGIITPYVQQVKAIRALINDTEIPLPKVGSVEEFQGQERQIILLSTVRSAKNFVQNDIKHSLGFLNNPKRMNVAISRAKSLLIIFGNPHLLVTDPNWKQLLLYCVNNHAYSGCDLPSSVAQIQTYG